MDCEQVRSLLSDLLDGSLPDSVRSGVNGHLRECLSCRSEREGLEETLLQLRSLPARKAPAELLERVRRGIAREKARETPLWKKLFLPVHVKIPLEAAAVVLITLLVIGTQKQELPARFSPPPPARTDAAPPANEGVSGKPSVPERKETGAAPVEKTTAPKKPAASRSAAVDEREAPSTPPATSPRTALPVVPAQRVSTTGERIEPASPPPGLARTAPIVRVMTIEVSPENRAGLEERIAAAALRWGGSVRVDAPLAGGMPEGGGDGVHVRLPAHSAAPFLDELSRMGTLPPEGDIGGSGLSAGVPPEPVAYTVRIRVR